MKTNKTLIIGITLLSGFFLMELVGNLFFEIRDEHFYSMVYYLETAFLTLTAIILLIGLYRIKSGWKWFFSIPLLLFIIVYLLGTLLFPTLSNELTLKEDTEVLFVNQSNANRKIVRQVYWTGITGDSYHSDTLKVYEFSSVLRLVRPIKPHQLSSDWVRVKQSN